MRKLQVMAIALVGVCHLAQAQKTPPPIIDMHLHALPADAQGPAPMNIGAPFREYPGYDPKNEYPAIHYQRLKGGTTMTRMLTSPGTDDSLRIQTLALLDKYNIFAVCSGTPDMVRRWKRAAPLRIINAVEWTFADSIAQKLTLDSLQKLFTTGGFKVFGEIAIQYEGYAPSDPALDPYLAMAEKLDVPVAIHVGPGPGGTPYLGQPRYRAGLHSALGLEEALVKHPKLRIYAMHAGWPFADDMIAMLYAHPQLYVDLGVICYTLPLAEFYRYLQRLVDAGFGKRILFGSDQLVWPQAIEIAIQNIEAAPFLNKEQKRDIFFNNAARFLRLSAEEIRNMQAGL